MKRLFLHRLLAWKEGKNRKPLLVKGVRQVGKTFLLRAFGEEHFPAYHYLNFEKSPQLCSIFEEDLDPKRILREIGLLQGEKIDPARDLVIFDEIQECPRALTSLKYFCEEMPELHLCGAGSLLGIHLAPLSFPVGKVAIDVLYPMTFEEFLMALDDQKGLNILTESVKGISEGLHQHLWNQLKLYFVVGGMPEAVASFVQEGNLQLVREIQDWLLSAYYADMAKHSGKVNAMHLDRLFRSIPSQLQSSVDGKSPKFRFRGVIPGMSHFSRIAGAIDWLEAAGLVIKIPIIHSANLPLQANVVENRFKLLLFDIGMLGAMSGLSPKVLMGYDYGTHKGFFVENFVAQEFLSRAAQALYCWREKTAEVEFVTEIEGMAAPIEVKSGKQTRSKSLSIFREKYLPKHYFILHASAPQPPHYLPLYLASKLI
ncbi:MAG: AAA family ATPase [Simkaniaceae bacterium]|nr:AAA family ATPase [Simkaniaceae bacterium]